MCDLGEADAAVRSAYPAIAQRDCRRVKLKKLGADPFGAFADLDAGGRNRATGHDHRTRTPGARRIGCDGGIAMHDTHLLGLDAENFVGDLSERGLETLTMGMQADADFEPAVWRHARIGLL